MVLGHGQKELIKKQMEADTKPDEKLPVKEGSIVSFSDTPEYNGIVKRISNDQWQTVFIEYGKDSNVYIINGYEFNMLFKNGKVKVITYTLKKGTKIEFASVPDKMFIIKEIKKNKEKTIHFSSEDNDSMDEISKLDLIRMVKDGKVIIKK